MVVSADAEQCGANLMIDLIRIFMFSIANLSNIIYVEESS